MPGTETVQQTRLKKFMGRNIRREVGQSCICSLLQRKHKHGICSFASNGVPFQDHPQLFRNRETHELIFIHQPYVCMHEHERSESCGKTLEKIRRESEKFATEHGLMVRVSLEDSWHFPGSTVLVEYRKIQ